MAIDFTPQIDFEEEKASPEADSPSFLDKVKDVGERVAGAAMPELKSAVDVYNSPVGDKLKDISAIPYQGLRGLATGVADLPQGPQQALQRASEATKPGFEPQSTPEKVADVGAQIIEPRSLLAGKLLEAAAPLANKGASELGKQASKLQEVLTGVDDINFQKLFTDPKAVLGAPSSKVTGKAFQAAKEAAGLTMEEERKLAINEGARKKIYQKVMSAIDNMKPLEKGEQLAVNGNGLPSQTLTHIGPMMGDTPEALKDMGMSDSAIKEVKQPMYNLSNGLVDHPANSTLSHKTLTDLGYDIPERGASNTPSVADLLRAKKAGQLIAESNPSASGLIQKEIHEKINPLLKEMAPEVYNTQQAVHLSKVKESLLNLFPQGKGMMNYFRVISMLGGSLFHGVGALESPMVNAGLTLGAKGATMAASSGPAKLAYGAGLNSLVQNKANMSALQSARDRLKNLHVQ